MLELTANLWAFLDAGTGVIYALAARPYVLAGDDESKLRVLRELSRHDYRSARRSRVPERLQITYGDGTTKSGVTTPRAVNEPNSMLFEHIFAEMEHMLPPLPDFSSGRPIPQKFSDDPLCTRTIVYEDDAGDGRAIVDEADRAWLERQMR